MQESRKFFKGGGTWSEGPDRGIIVFVGWGGEKEKVMMVSKFQLQFPKSTLQEREHLICKFLIC